MKNIIIFLFLSISNILFAQTNTDYLLIPKVKAGVTFPGITSWYYTGDQLRRSNNDLFPVFPGYSIGIGLETAALISYYNVDLSLSLETSYGQATTGEVKTYFGKSKYTITSLPVLFWTTIKTNGKIVPFVRIGAGTERTEHIEKYYSQSLLDFDLTKWTFSWGIGAGIEVNYDNYNVSLFVDNIIKESGIAHEFSDGRNYNYNFRNGIILSGIQIGLKL